MLKIIFLSLFVSLSAFAEDIRCVETPNDGTHFDIFLTNYNGKLNFKRCNPGYHTGMKCVIYVDTICDVFVKTIGEKQELTGKCSWVDMGDVKIVYTFIPVKSKPLQHVITLQVDKEKPKFFGKNYFCSPFAPPTPQN